MNTQIPIPPHFNPAKVGEIWRVPYQKIAAEAETYAVQQQIQPSALDKNRVCLLLIDVQNTFCIPDFELFVGGQTGTGAVEDNQRLCAFIYRNLGVITKIIPTLDTHTTMQIFHPIFWINTQGEHPTPAATNITVTDIEKGIWQVNPAVANSITNGDYDLLGKQAFYYVQQLSQNGKYPLTVWPYHSMLGGIGHALVASVEEAVFFHSIARKSQTQFELKGENPLTENYSILRPEILTGFNGQPIGQKNTSLIQQLLEYDAVIIAGQAKSHCVAWTIDDLFTEIQQVDSTLTRKIYLLEDCTSPVVVPGVVDYTEQANNIFARFAAAGMHIIQSTQELVIG
ncbi:MAG: cysteine hydrolase family protein [Anabaena sp. CoA2_C59]|jgi:nicotinamidase-related amidase|uniref:Isochorismatase n=1 Tax=Aphanizomenon flos-aquae WA102 TaxID=1710896 RepID=A0A1B7X5U5_APHFL|nr:cysteine hydrolase family protein [Aphanizomenon flos-aquae Clear-A1]MCE2904214.1 cysteine hydrolase family protein [Anabaena sp. CoA2_C59]MDJ0505744.1 cysteine hydrolase family protein [Nostocales cyanobacterium LE14-WE12]OBQ19492.1 MAG: isochorismatase [Anabaena sp. WA113]OBQ44732.1 MAG: isochorismatase [Aphanizomenon flos-aquae WA102]QSV68432.1 MAG: cysteine hydrolase family protein [Aphanizomenon flos-aquae DEX188]